MSSQGRQRRSRLRGLHVERIEERTMMSVIPILLNLGRIANHSATPADTSSGGNVDPTAKPTAHELAREHFVAKLSGSYAIGPGRFTNQASQAFFLATGGSTQALHLNLQMNYFTPTDPTQLTTGTAALSDKNVGSSGNTLILDLTAVPGATFHGLPTKFTWSVDPSSGGLWQNATAGVPETTNQGTLQVHYIPSGKLPQRAHAAGKAFLVFKGLVYTTGVTNDLAAPGNRPTSP